jgi:hypothetical protein
MAGCFYIPSYGFDLEAIFRAFYEFFGFFNLLRGEGGAN